MLKKIRLYALLTLFLILGLSCSKSPVSNQPPLVLVSISPYQAFVKMIAEETVETKICVPENFNPHLYEPSPNQMKGFHKAKLWFGIGMPFEKKLAGSLKTLNPNLIFVNLSKGIPLLNDTKDTIIIHSDDVTSHNHSHDCEDHNHNHNHNHDCEDLHFWMSPAMMKIQVKTITDALCKEFPTNQDLYTKNLNLVLEKLSSLDEELISILTPYEGSAVITSHPSLTYFCKSYGLNQISIESDGKSPLPKDISKILSLTKKQRTLCVFTQEQFDNKGAIAIAKRLRLPIYKLNPHDPEYFSNLQKIASEIKHAGDQN